MRSLIAALLFTLLLPAITQASIVCDMRDKATEIVPKSLSEILECNNPGQIKDDFNSTLDRFNICNQNQGFVSGEMTCTMISKFVVDKFVSTIPETWNCSAEQFSLKSEILLRKYCIEILNPKK